MPRHLNPVNHGAVKREKELKRADRNAARAARRDARRAERRHEGHVSNENPTEGMAEPVYGVDDPSTVEDRDCPVEQLPNRFPDAPEAFHGIARTLSRGL